MRKNLLHLSYELVLVVFVSILSAGFSGSSNHIVADGTGYYDYLPSTFIHHDLVRNGKPLAPTDRIATLDVYSPCENGKVNKYHCGTAVLMSPFFLSAYSFHHGEDITGYEAPFQSAILVAALFYLVLALVFLRKLLNIYSVRPAVICISQFLLVFATNVLYYTATESAFSHIYSLFAVTTFLYCVKQYCTHHKPSMLLWMGILLGLITIIRPVNILIVLFVPFMCGSFDTLRSLIHNLKIQTKYLLASLILFLVPITIQSLMWYLQTGHWFVYSYGNESFDFTNPHMLGILCSFRKGLFVYTPILLLTIIYLLYLVRRKSWFTVLTFVLPMAALTYVLSSWHDWVYGFSYGLRAFIEYFPLFFLLIALLLNEKHHAIQLLYLPIGCFIALNLLQTWQYKEYILHWYNMDFAKYKKVFLKTSAPYKGILWKPQPDAGKFKTNNTFQFQQHVVAENNYIDTVLYQAVSTVENSAPLAAVRISLNHEFPETNTTQIELNIMRGGEQVIYTRSVYLIHFADGELGVAQRGNYWYDLRNADIKAGDYLIIRVFNDHKNEVLDAVKIELLVE